MNRALLINLFLFPLLFAPFSAATKTSDRNQPMTIDSAAQEGSMLGANGKAHYSGNVVIQQGTLEAHADTADVFLKNGDMDRIVLIGKQASLKQEMDDGSTVHGQADNIDYKIKEGIVILTGNYKVESPKGNNTGQRMIYNTQTGDMRSGNDGTRVRTTIQPKNVTQGTLPAAKQEKM
ncbi:MAG TPA: lipopolysaccharide transport periplasmic protein LptA [Xylella taiwanensis]